MSDIKFDCPRCKQSLEAPDDMAGQQIGCPICSHKVVIPPRITAHVHKDRPSVASNMLHLIGSPTILVIILALALPFLSVSCNGQKLMSATGFKLLTSLSEDSAKYGESLPSEYGNIWFLVAITIVGITGIISTVSCIILAIRRNRSLLWFSVGASIIGIIAILSLGYYFGVRVEGEIKANQASSLDTSDGWESLGAAMAASLDISTDMDAGYYLIFSALVLGLTGLLVPSIFTKPINSGKIVGGSIAGSVFSIALIYSVAMCLNSLAKPARYKSPEEMAGMFDEPSRTPSSASLFAPIDEGTPSEALLSKPPPKPRRPLGIVNQKLFGCFLGETIRDMRSRGISVSESDYRFTDEDHPGVIWDLYASDIGNPAVKEARVSTFNEMIYELTVFFKDNTKSNYAVLESQLENKYGGKRSTISFMDEKVHFDTHIDGASVTITLFFEDSFDDDKDQLSVTYIYDDLVSKLIDDVQRRKADKVSHDL